jgi:hypothetical protein
MNICIVSLQFGTKEALPLLIVRSSVQKRNLRLQRFRIAEFTAKTRHVHYIVTTQCKNDLSFAAFMELGAKQTITLTVSRIASVLLGQWQKHYLHCACLLSELRTNICHVCCVFGAQDKTSVTLIVLSERSRNRTTKTGPAQHSLFL